MSRKPFNQEKQEIKDEILLLSSMVEQAVMYSVEALRDHDLDRAHEIRSGDTKINRRRFEIELSLMVLIATQQPIAHDLRLLVGGLHICTELERIADYAKGIANINIRAQGLGMPDILRDIYFMGEQTIDMLHRAMTAFSNEDAHAAKAILYEDEAIDECYRRIYFKAVNRVLGDARNIEQANFLIGAAHHLERLGDRVINICQQVIYIATGEHAKREDTLQATKFPV